MITGGRIRGRESRVPIRTCRRCDGNRREVEEDSFEQEEEDDAAAATMRPVRSELRQGIADAVTEIAIGLGAPVSEISSDGFFFFAPVWIIGKEN